MTAINEFRDAMRSAGLIPPDMIEPGKFHRFPGEGKRKGNAAAWCKLFPDGIGGIYGDYSTGLSADWQAKRDKPYTQVECDAFKRYAAEAKAQGEAERKAKQTKAASKAATIWEAPALLTCYVCYACYACYGKKGRYGTRSDWRTDTRSRDGSSPATGADDAG